jgi:hypothetical protein
VRVDLPRHRRPPCPRRATGLSQRRARRAYVRSCVRAPAPVAPSKRRAAHYSGRVAPCSALSKRRAALCSARRRRGMRERRPSLRAGARERDDGGRGAWSGAHGLGGGRIL